MDPRAGSAPSTALARTLAPVVPRFDGVRGLRAPGLSAGIGSPPATEVEAAETSAPRVGRSVVRAVAAESHPLQQLVDLVAIGLALGRSASHTR